MKSVRIIKIAAVAAMAVTSLASYASLLDASIVIDRAANNRTLTVRYEGANAAIVELRINGKSISSREVTDSASSGETNFAINTAALEDGQNKVEIRLYDARGKLLGTEKTEIMIDRQGTGPVFISAPRSGETMQGIVEIKVGFRTEIKNAYVSFFVNDEFKILKNFPPYSYRWDTTGANNGWHEVQAWVVDDANATFKTEKLRLYVNNPGGRTEREPVTKPTTGTTPPANTSKVEEKPETKPGTVLTAPNKTGVQGGSQVKPGETGGGLATGPRLLDPAKNAQSQKGGTQPGAPTVIEIHGNTVISPSTDIVAGKTELKPLAINFGTRLPDTNDMTIYLNGQPVAFDVNPRVLDGVPLTPFRHLFEGYGGEVKWEHASKTVSGDSDGLKLTFRIGDPQADVNGLKMMMEMAPYIERGRSIVPLSFMSQALNVNITYDPNTGHVLILSKSPK
ncbi:stalk domain-containing protein [Kamptonema cortianum]|nr:stalk domain-containing protein [Geitlerinema splendidum]MDK3156912.1 stalk domain-containing protein [Kamptonema cortianum]